MGTENGKDDGIPLAFSVLSGHGTDAMLLDTAVELSRGVTKVAEMYWKRGGREAGPRGAEQRAEEAKTKVGGLLHYLVFIYWGYIFLACVGKQSCSSCV